LQGFAKVIATKTAPNKESLKKLQIWCGLQALFFLSLNSHIFTIPSLKKYLACTDAQIFPKHYP
jgi:hypothetical protein